MIVFRNTRLLSIFVAVTFFFSVLLSPNIASAAVLSSETTKFIFQYGPDGGIAFSVAATTKSLVTYSGTSSTLRFSNSDASISVTGGYGISQCGSTMAVRASTNFSGDFGSSTINLPHVSTYITNPNTTIVGRNSGSDWSRGLGGSYTISFQNEGYIQPSPSKCFGGGTVSNTLTYTQ